MKFLKVLAFVPLWFVLVADTPSPPPVTPSACTPAPGSPTITLSPAAGRATTKITASGTSFPCNDRVTLYWDNQGHVAGSAPTNSKGGFSVSVVPFPGDKAGTHRLCAVAPSNPCANYQLMAAPPPTPKASPERTPTPSPSPSPSPSPIVLPSNNDQTPTALDILTRPPFVFFPIIAVLGILGAIAYWALSKVQRAPANLPTASVVHRSARPDMGPLTPVLPPTSPPPAPPAPTPEPEPRPPEPEG